ncbi:hypothetical protein PPERSA_01391 [Pseudocohnilembus persalinus]|uniref:Uncharacterized protein n=1 Tax=Pseudocohnilembus persalinus TaxID=266149 RepID=A0A0V0QHF9_PSEPJ|nr:hypothetical protein PPERSA_01391 [Pseudocohnilembus persalinus]|eukprot:KRX01488.1 hypothetical protein PPERSA_01391 [Pseudocohnilembus persalinus]
MVTSKQIEKNENQQDQTKEEINIKQKFQNQLNGPNILYKKKSSQISIEDDIISPKSKYKKQLQQNEHIQKMQKILDKLKIDKKLQFQQNQKKQEAPQRKSTQDIINQEKQLIKMSNQEYNLQKSLYMKKQNSLNKINKNNSQVLEKDVKNLYKLNNIFLQNSAMYSKQEDTQQLQQHKFKYKNLKKVIKPKQNKNQTINQQQQNDSEILELQKAQAETQTNFDNNFMIDSFSRNNNQIKQNENQINQNKFSNFPMEQNFSYQKNQNIIKNLSFNKRNNFSSISVKRKQMHNFKIEHQKSVKNQAQSQEKVQSTQQFQV